MVLSSALLIIKYRLLHRLGQLELGIHLLDPALLRPELKCADVGPIAAGRVCDPAVVDRARKAALIRS